MGFHFTDSVFNVGWMFFDVFCSPGLIKLSISTEDQTVSPIGSMYGIYTYIYH